MAEAQIIVPSLADIQKEIYTQIQSNVINILADTLEKLAKDKDLDLDELKVTYLTPLQKIMSQNQMELEKTLTRKNKNIAPGEQCMARTGNGTQCSRKRQGGREYCGSHVKAQPYGRIDIANESIVKSQKKRGRPPKSSKDLESNTSQKKKGDANERTEIETEAEEEDEEEEVIQVNYKIKEIDGTKYIIDDSGYIYEHPEGEAEIQAIEDLKRVGQELDTDIPIWF